MNYLYVCNTGSDKLSKINLKNLYEEKRIVLSNSPCKVGPHGLCPWKSEIITANSYGSSISIIETAGNDKVEEYYIGGNCNDVRVFRSHAFITCGGSNNIVVFDLESKRTVEEIPVGNLPHSIDISYNREIMVVTNMDSDSISIYNCINHELIKNISVGSYPTKAIFSDNDKFIYVCESNLGGDTDGFINIVSVDTLSSVGKIKAGKSPIDIIDEGNMCYVTNFCEGYVSQIYLDEMEIVKRMFTGGMPRGIIKKGRALYIGDNYGNSLIKYDVFNDKKQSITIGKEPTGMISV